MGILGWLVLGLICGAAAKTIMGAGPEGWVANLLIGILGATIGGWIGSALFHIKIQTFWSWQTWLIGILGSCLVLFIYHKFIAKKPA